jgi:hypothetical protein
MDEHKNVKKSQLLINTPCHENWSEMSPTEQGKFCGVCATEVVDFAAMSDEQVAQFFANYKGGHLCGRIVEKQTTLPLRCSPPAIVQPFQPTHWRKIAAGFLLATSLTACKSKPHGQSIEKMGEVHVMGKTAAPRQTTLQNLLKGDGLQGIVTKNDSPKAYANVGLYDGDELLVKTQTKADGLFTLKFPDFDPSKHKNLRIQASHMEYFEVSHNASSDQIIPQPLTLELGEPTHRKGKIKIQD